MSGEGQELQLEATGLVGIAALSAVACGLCTRRLIGYCLASLCLRGGIARGHGLTGLSLRLGGGSKGGLQHLDAHGRTKAGDRIPARRCVVSAIVALGDVAEAGGLVYAI